MLRVNQTRSACRPRAVALAAVLAVALVFGALGPAAHAADTAAERPARGLTMSEVETRYGAPVERTSVIGQPPITRWEYPSFVVYFEHDRVIHAVLTAPAPAPAAAASTPGS